MKKKYALVAALTALVALVSAAIPALAQNEAQAVDAEQASGPVLGIKSPGIAPVGEEVTMTVFDRQTTEAVEGAGVWVVSREKAGELEAEIASLSEDGSAEASDSDYGSQLDVHGELVDWTDGSGLVTHTFDEPGLYLLVAVKDGYFPGFALVRATRSVKALGIRAPRVAIVGTDVTVTVFDRQTKGPVEGAGVWLMSRENAEGLRAEIAALREEGNTAAAEQDYVDLVSAHGEFLDFTDQNGQVTHTFGEEGVYLLVAVKDGYFPGFAPINIKAQRLVLGIRVPRVVKVDEEVTITVFDRQTKEPEEGAGVWLMSRENAEGLKAEIARLKETGNTAAAEQDYVDLVSAHGEFLDFTDGNGQVTHTFEEVGRYLLVALQDGYFPGFSMIGVKAELTAASPSGQGAATALRSAAQLRAAGSGGHQNMARAANQVKAKKAVRAAGTVAAKARNGNAWADAD